MVFIFFGHILIVQLRAEAHILLYTHEVHTALFVPRPDPAPSYSHVLHTRTLSIPPSTSLDSPSCRPRYTPKLLPTHKNHSKQTPPNLAVPRRPEAHPCP